jgi:hypothetical protein
MFFNKNYLFIILFVLSIGVIFFNYEALKREYNIVNSHGGGSSTINLVDLYSGYFVDNIVSKFTAKSLPGLPVIDLYMPEKSISVLESELPKNIKNWVPAYLRYPDGEYNKISARYRGDNLFNWSYKRKSYRLKLKKKNLIDAKRSFNYVPLSKTNTLAVYLPYFIGRLAGLPTPDARLIEFRLNGENHGIYLEHPKLDEGFLRRNNFMPVNIYKGEQFHTSRDQYRGVELFNNPALWNKTSIFNQRDVNNFDDLARLIDLISSSYSSDQNFLALTDIANLDQWARFDALQTLLQSWHNDDEHNMRLISDVWSGQMLPIVFEVISNVDPDQDLLFENPPHSLFKVLNQSSAFLALKYQSLYSMLSEGILSASAQHVLELKSNYENSLSRDIFRGASININENNQKLDISWEQYAKNLKEREDLLLKKMLQPSQSSWKYKNKVLSLSVDGGVPLSNPEFTLRDDSNITDLKIYFDEDSNGKISDSDTLIPLRFVKDKLFIDAKFFANRILHKSAYSDYPQSMIANTVFNLISNTNLDIMAASSKQFFNGKRFPLDNKDIVGQTPNTLNKPLFRVPVEEEVWSGLVLINETRFINKKVKIMPGTTISIGKGASLIFKNQVIAIGSENSKINFIPQAGNEVWGSLALIGPGTMDSAFNHVNISGGSGYDAPNLRIVGMFSIHNTSNINLSNMEFSNNHVFDDLIHIVYSRNISLKNSTVTRSLFDAIDIDISQVDIENCTIAFSGNDGIDSMSSIVKIKNTNIFGSIDKGVSIGEKSKILIINSKIQKNNIGVESKDMSVANIFKSSVLQNTIDINAYKKNWQYGGGGVVYLLDYNKYSSLQNLKTDKHSTINVFEGTTILKDNINVEYFDDINLISDTLKSWNENLDYYDSELNL